MRNIEDNKALCEEMPYIAVHNSWTGKVIDDYDYSYIEADSLPNGWQKLFIQMCRDLKKPLEDARLINSFYFTQVKSKYGSLRAYNNGATRDVQDIINKYEHLSQFICEKCGKPAKYQTTGWIESYCDDCIKEVIKPEYIDECEKIEFEPIIHLHGWTNGGEYDKYIDCSEEWRRLYKENEDG